MPSNIAIGKINLKKLVKYNTLINYLGRRVILFIYSFLSFPLGVFFGALETDILLNGVVFICVCCSNARNLIESE